MASIRLTLYFKKELKTVIDYGLVEFGKTTVKRFHNEYKDIKHRLMFHPLSSPRELGHKFCWQILYLVYLLLFAEWQEGIQKTDQSCGMIAEYLLEREVCLRIQVLHNHLF